MSKNLSEERIRMRKLMGFTYEDNSHDILSEQTREEKNKKKRIEKAKADLKKWKDKEKGIKYDDDRWTDEYIESWIVGRLSKDHTVAWKKGTEESKAAAIENIRNKFQTYGEKKTIKNIHPEFVRLLKVAPNDIEKEGTFTDLSFTLTDKGFNPFPNNGSQPGTDLINAINEKVSQFTVECPNDPPKTMGIISRIEVYTSCSRLRNTLTPNKTWLELAEDRTRNAYSEIATRFGDAGYPVPGTEDGTPNALVLDWEGDNGDGSSGKEDPYKNGKIITGGEENGIDSLKEVYYSKESCEKHNKQSPPCGDNRSDLDQYKYIKVIIKGECIKVVPDADVEYTFHLGTEDEYEKDTSKGRKKKRSWCWQNGGLRYCFKRKKGEEGGKWSTNCDKKTQRKIKRQSKKGEGVSFHNTNMKNKEGNNKKNQYKRK